MTLSSMQSGRMSDPEVMRCRNKTSLIRRTARILRNEEGASIVLVTIISIIVVASVIILAINVNSLIASADKQYSRDQAYEAAKSMGSSFDTIISKGQMDLKAFADGSEVFSDSSQNIDVKVKVKSTGQVDTYTLIVTAETNNEEYVYTATYYGSGKTYMRIS